MNNKIFASTSRLETLFQKIEVFFKEKDAHNVVIKFSDGKYANSICTISLKKYDSLGSLMSFANLKWLSELLNTEEITLENEYHNDGCDTCDWGSYDAGDIVCRNINPFNEE